MRRMQTLAIAGCLVLVGAEAAAATSPASPGASIAPAAGSSGRIAYTFGLPGTDAHVFTMAPDGTDVIQVTPFDSHYSVWSPDATRLAVPQARSDGLVTTTVIGWDGSDPLTMTLPDDSSLNLAPAAWSPDGTTMAFDGWSDTQPALNGIHTGTPTGEDLIRITTVPEPGAHDPPIAYSPDGRSLLILRLPASGDFGDLYLMAPDGSGMRQLTTEGQHAWLNSFSVPASWSPDGAFIAYTAFEGPEGRSATFVVSASGGDPVQVSDWGSYNTGARFSPDGQWVLYDTALANGQHDLFIVHPDGSSRTRRTDARTTGMGNCCGTWAPDGQSVLFQAGPDSAAQLWTVSVDGTGARQLTTEAGEYGGYAWAATPSGKP